MKFRDLVLTGLLLVISSLAFAQQDETTDVVKLKSGALYKGQISEYVPGDSLHMLLLDGRRKSFSSHEIASISEAGNQVISVKEKGFFHTSSVVAMMQSDYYGLELTGGFLTVNGYKYGRSQFGLGSGVEMLTGDLYIPVYADYTYNFIDGAFSPFAAASAGMVFNPDNSGSEYDYWWGSQRYEQGVRLGLRGGIKGYLGSHVGLQFSVGYQYYYLTGEYNQYWGPEIILPVEQQAHLHRVSIALGLIIN